MKTYITLAFFICLLWSSCSSSTEPGTATNADTSVTDTLDSSYINPDSVAFSFVFVGCNRIDWKDTAKANTNASTANLPELKRTFDEVSQLEPKPKYFFFLGDLVLGLNKTPGKLQSELEAWVTQYQSDSFSTLPKSGIKLVAVPGNHEMLYYDQATNEEIPWEPATGIWEEVMSSFVPNEPLNRIGGADSLINRQTYSFDYNNTHFIMLNTDTYNPELKLGQLPVDWVMADIAAARQRGVEHVFLMGHKPSYVDAPMTKTDDRMDTTITDQLWPVMEQHEVEAMLSAHSHQYYRTQPHPQKSYQIIAGNGGSPYVKHLTSEDQFFGYSIVYVMKNGAVLLRSMGRYIPAASYLESIPDSVKTTVRDQIDMSWGTEVPAWN